MRKLKLFTVAFVFGMTTLFASESIDDTNIEIRDQIVQLIENKQIESNYDFETEFTFTFNSNGEIVILNVDSSKSEVKDFLRENINTKKLMNPGIKDKRYTMPIKVKSII